MNAIYLAMLAAVSFGLWTVFHKIVSLSDSSWAKA